MFEGRKVGESGAGMAVTISGSTLSFGGETFECDRPITGKVRVSFFDELVRNEEEEVVSYTVFISVWQNGTYLHTFVSSDAGSSEYFRIGGTSNAQIGVHISEACMRIDNFILDEGQSGASLTEQLIGEKRFFFQESDFGVRLFRERASVNDEAHPYTLAVAGSDADSDVNIVTRVRVEGSDVFECIDEELMRQYGNLYRLVHLNEVNSPSDAELNAQIVLEEFGSRLKNVSLTGAADLRVEPNDVIWVQFPGGVCKVIVDAVDVTTTISESDASFDMSVSGRVPRSEL